MGNTKGQREGENYVLDATAGSILLKANSKHDGDDRRAYFGAGDDARISYDGTDLKIEPAVVGTGEMKVVGGSVELDAAEAIYLGDANTDGTWRMIRSGNDLLMQRRESGAYVTKSTISA